jgi:hypothetical protein
MTLRLREFLLRNALHTRSSTSATIPRAGAARPLRGRPAGVPVLICRDQDAAQPSNEA